MEGIYCDVKFVLYRDGTDIMLDAIYIPQAWQVYSAFVIRNTSAY
jgi:hypothetical protein